MQCDNDSVKMPDKNREYIHELEMTLESYEKSMKEIKNEQNIFETTIQKKNDRIYELEVELKKTIVTNDMKIDSEMKSDALLDEIDKDKEDSLEGQKKIGELIEIIEEKENRISELEDALRETIKLSTEREIVLHTEEKKRKDIMEKVSAELVKPKMNKINKIFVPTPKKYCGPLKISNNYNNYLKTIMAPFFNC